MSTSTKITDNSKQPVGIGGWLLLPIAVLLYTVYGAWDDIQQANMVLLDPELWKAFKTPGTLLYHSPWVIVLVIAAIIQVGIFIVAIIALAAIYKKKKIVPRIMISFYVLALCLVVTDMATTFFFISKISPELANNMAPELIRKMVGMGVGAIIFIPYFIKSKRVKNTFVN